MGKTRKTGKTQPVAPLAPLRVRVPLGVLLGLAALVVTAWLLRPSGHSQVAQSDASPPPPTLADLEKPPPPLPRNSRIGVIQQLVRDPPGIILSSGMESLLLQTDGPVGSLVGKGDTIEVDGREVGRSRFGQVYLRGTYRIIKSLPRPSPAMGSPRRGTPGLAGIERPRPAPVASLAPQPGRGAATPASASAPKLDQVFGTRTTP